MTHQTILVLDFGSQYTQLIARRLRELSVYSEILPSDTPIGAKSARRNPAGIILSGGPSSVSDPARRRSIPAILELGTPTLGICYGMQLMTATLGGHVRTGAQPRVRARHRHICATGAPLFDDVPTRSRVWASHGDFVAAAPPGFDVVATSANAPVAAIADAGRGLFGLLFHPEVVHTERGDRHPRELRVRRLRLPRRLDDGVVRRRERRAHPRAGRATGSVVCGLSGGVDSTVAALLIHKAIGDRLTCIFVDNGLLRLDEAAQVRTRFERLDLPLEFVDATDLFLDRVAGVTDPEQKRKIIGGAFIDVFESARTSSAGSTSSRRARCIRTSSRASRSSARRPRSRAITTSAGCPSG